jgi:D-amino-acid oxidase
MRVVVVGTGVVGLTTAVCLREAGVAADVVARELGDETTSAVAAALWYPYRALPADRVTAWSAATYAELQRLASVAASGVRMRAGLEMLSPDAPDPWWRDAVPDLRRTTVGLRFTAPTIDMSIHLPWLAARVQALGGAIERRHVGSLEELEADAVVNCAGLGARELAGDSTLSAVRGQVVRVAAPSVREWLIDQSDPERLVYVVPRATSCWAARRRRASRTARPTPRPPRPSARAAVSASPRCATRLSSTSPWACVRRGRRCAWRPRVASCTATATAAPG